MSANKQTVEQYMEAFAGGDVAQVVACLAPEVEWEVPGTFRLKGSDAFATEMANPAFTGVPRITTTRLLAEGDVVVAEGQVETTTAKGEPLTLRFCDVFELSDGKIRKLTSYLMPIN